MGGSLLPCPFSLSLGRLDRPPGARGLSKHFQRITINTVPSGTTLGGNSLATSYLPYRGEPMTKTQITIPAQEIQVTVPGQEIQVTIPIPSQTLPLTIPACTVTITLPDDPEPPPPPPSQLRGVRGQSRTCATAAQCATTIERLAAAGVNTYYYDVTDKGYWARSSLMHNLQFDALGELVPLAHERGMQIGALLNVAFLDLAYHDEWNARYTRDLPQSWLDFSIPAAREFVARVAEEIVTNYEVDLILLDYIRYRSSWADLKLLAEHVTACVQTAHDRIAPIPLVASVYKSRASAANARQRWWEWLDDRLIDYVTPMAYVGDDELRALLDDWKQTGHFPNRIIPRISTCTFSPTTTPRPIQDVLDQIAICYAQGATGMTLWDDRHICNNQDLIQALANGGW
jgi:hypothetical protein